MSAEYGVQNGVIKRKHIHKHFQSLTSHNNAVVILLQPPAAFPFINCFVMAYIAKKEDLGLF